jgi:uncharacterized membrane protein YkvA (DUF1232 family)
MADKRKERDTNLITGGLAEIIRQVRLVIRLWSDPRVATWVKTIPPIALAYTILPFDFLPDLILGLGQLDDVAIVLLGMKLFVELCPPEVVRQHLEDLGATVSSGQPQEGVAQDQGEVIDGSYRVVEED